MGTKDDNLDFVREPVTAPVPHTFYVAIVLTVEERSRILRGLSEARTYLRSMLPRTYLTEAQREAFQLEIDEFDLLSARLYGALAATSREQAIKAAQ